MVAVDDMDPEYEEHASFPSVESDSAFRAPRGASGCRWRRAQIEETEARELPDLEDGEELPF